MSENFNNAELIKEVSNELIDKQKQAQKELLLRQLEYIKNKTDQETKSLEYFAEKLASQQKKVDILKDAESKFLETGSVEDYVAIVAENEHQKSELLRELTNNSTHNYGLTLTVPSISRNLLIHSSGSSSRNCSYAFTTSSAQPF